MRLMFAIAMTLFLLGGTYFYTGFADSVRRPPVDLQVKMDESVWRVVIERTFECNPDPDLDVPSLTVQFKGQTLFSRVDSIPVAEVVEFAPIPNVEQGDNDLFIEANLASTSDFEFDSSELSHALRVVVYRGSEIVKDQTHWLKRGDFSIFASVAFAAPLVEENHDNHEHK